MFDLTARNISGCGLTALMSESGQRVNGEAIISSIALLHDRGNGMGGGFAAYGIYPERAQDYALHLMYYQPDSQERTERILDEAFEVRLAEPIPTRPVPGIPPGPALWRYFVQPREEAGRRSSADDYVLSMVMRVNAAGLGAYVFSSGRNMGAFKALGYAEDVGRFYRLEEYQGHIWIAHGRFPTNTPGWWAGAHPFTLLDWAVVHNGEISSYGTNRRYLEMFGYRCTMQTDTEVVAYLLDLLLRRHRLPLEVAVQALASPFWHQIERLPKEQQALAAAIRQVYGSALLNGPFAIVFAHSGGMVGLNDRIKLRPLVAARHEDFLYLASEEAAIRVMCPHPERVWAPEAGQPVVGRVRGAALEVVA